MKKFIEFLSSIPMTIVSGAFIATSLILSVTDTYTLVDPAWGAAIISGIPLIYSAIRKIIKNKGISKISSALLISIAMIAAIATKEVFAAGEVAFIMAIGEILEDITTARSRKGLKKLIELTPIRGRVIKNNTEEIVEISEINVYDVLRILPGETIPADGVIISGNSSIDQSVITGESLPVEKAIGDTVYCGTINRFGSIDIKVTKANKDSSLSQLIHLIEEAEKNKAPMQRVADKWASWLVPVALIVAIVAGLIRWNIQVAVTILVVFCPCALVLATPTAIMAAIGNATKRGIIIKSGEAIEKLGKIDTIAFDKTGTLTYGMLSVSDIITCENLSDNELLQLAASAESLSEHPLGKAIVQYAREKKVDINKPDEFQMESGKGVISVINNKKIICGNEKLIVEQGIELSEMFTEKLEHMRSQGKASVIVADETHVMGLIGLADVIRDGASEVIDKLERMDVNTVLLTGDSDNAAQYMAQQVGICRVYSELLPEEKVKMIYQLQNNDKRVCMIGDGVNDAPALKTVDVGIAMGAMGSDIAIDAADIALMSDDISKLPYLIRLSRATLKTIQFSILLSLLINFIAIILSFFGLLGPVTGALVHNAGSVFVILIAALLYDRKFKNKYFMI